jgi:hypothetical protein
MRLIEVRWMKLAICKIGIALIACLYSGTLSAQPLIKAHSNAEEIALIEQMAGVVAGDTKSKAEQVCRLYGGASEHIDCSCFAEEFVASKKEFWFGTFRQFVKDQVLLGQTKCMKTTNDVYKKSLSRCLETEGPGYRDCSCVANKYSGAQPAFDSSAFDAWFRQEGQTPDACISITSFLGRAYYGCTEFKIARRNLDCGCYVKRHLAQLKKRPVIGLLRNTDFAANTINACSKR